MDCNICQSLIPAYAAGDLSPECEQDCRMHLNACEGCRREYEGYKALIHFVAAEPVLAVTASERESLTLALARVKLPEPVCPSEDDRPAQGFLGFLLASIFAFFAIAGLLVTQTINLNTFIASADPIRVVKGLSTLGVVVFTTSFLPIVITARRRPLNGLTFRR